MLEIKKFSEYLNECGTCGCEESEGKEKEKDKVDCGDPKPEGDDGKECNESLTETKSFSDFISEGKEEPKEDEEKDDKEEGNVKNFDEFFK